MAGRLQRVGNRRVDETHSIHQPFAKSIISTTTPDSTILINEIIPLYKRLASDDQDSVRLLTIPDLIVIAEGLNPKTLVKEHVGEQLAASWTDKSWRVKYMLAERFVEVSDGSCREGSLRSLTFDISP